MNLKKLSRVYGKKVRSATGLTLPVAMRIGKELARGQFPMVIVGKFPTLSYEYGTYKCPCGNCFDETTVTLKGPKGSFQL